MQWRAFNSCAFKGLSGLFFFLKKEDLKLEEEHRNGFLEKLQEDLSGHTALVDDASLILSTHVGKLTTTCNSNPRGSDSIF